MSKLTADQEATDVAHIAQLRENGNAEEADLSEALLEARRNDDQPGVAAAEEALYAFRQNARRGRALGVTQTTPPEEG